MNKGNLIDLCVCLLDIGFVLQGLMQAITFPITGASQSDIAFNSAFTAIIIVILICCYPDELKEIWRMITKNYRG